MPQSRILIVEDEVIVSADLRAKLEQLGHSVCAVVRYGEKVLDAVLKNNPGLVLMDIKLKGEMDGITAAEALMDRLKMSVIFLTVFSDSATLNRAKAVEPLGFIRKPVLLEDLRVNIEIALYKRHMEQKLRQSEERLDLAIRGTNAGLWDWHVKTGGTVFNERWAQIIGYTLKELEPVSIQTWMDFCHPDDLEISNQHLKKHFTGESDFYRCECRMKHKNGAWIWVLSQGKIMEWDENGDPVRMAGTHIDITEKKQYEALIQAKRDMARAWSTAKTFKERLQICVNTAIRISSMDCGGFYLADETDDNFNLIVHQGLSESFILRASRFLSGSDNARLVREGKAIYTLHCSMVFPDNEAALKEGLHAIAVIPVCSGEKVIGCLNVASHTLNHIPDCTRVSLERMADYAGSFVLQEIKEEKIRKSQQNLEMLFNTIEDMGFILDMEACIISHNKAVGIRLGYAGDALIGQSVLAIHPPDRHEEAKKVMAAIFSGETDTCMIPLQTRNGDLIPVETKVKKGWWNGREAIIGISRDISERLEIEHKKRQIEKVECLSRMAGAIAHRFNNMMEVVMGNLELAMEDFSQNEEALDILTEAFQASREAAGISGLMLVYLGQPIGKHEPMDLTTLCQSCLPKLRAGLKKGVTLQAHLPLSGIVIKADMNQIRQVLSHLITNAAEAVEEGGGDIHVSLGTVFPEDIPPGRRFPVEYHLLSSPYACLEVRDTGHGIDETDMDRIFDPFFSTRFMGRGLGLPAVIGIVRAHGGMATVESKPGLGSIFRIFFPLSGQILPSGPEQQIQVSVTDPCGRILLVDDEPMVRTMVAKLLSRLGYDVIEARDGYEAVEMFREYKNEISCVLLDLTMPGRNGWETLAELRSIQPGVLVIMTSGYDEASVMDGKSTEQPQAFLHKPYSRDELKNVLSIRLNL